MKLKFLAATLALMFTHLAFTQPVLITVELNTRTKVEEWLAFGYPTYIFVHQTAIAEIDVTQIPFLLEKGFSVNVIDESPWTESYFMGSVPQPDTELPGDIIWQKDRTRIVKSATAHISDFTDLRLDFRLLKKQILPGRFWHNTITKVVPLGHMEVDPFIQSLVDQVNTDSLSSYIQHLQDFQTRLIFTDSSFAATEWIRQKFNSFGYIAEFDSFYIDSTEYGFWPDTGYERNVMAQIQGTVNPARIFIICAHHDAIIWPDTQSSWTFAPGADDNGSGVAAVLEAARILRNYTWKTSIDFVTWSAEEVGFLGSEHYARRADSLNLDIAGVINLDMLGWNNYPTLNCNIQHIYDFCLWLSHLFYVAGQTYAPELYYHIEHWVTGSDDVSFSSYGFPAITGIERWYYLNPNLHRPTDILSNMTPAMYTGITKAAVATLAILSFYPAQVNDVAIADIGNGNSLQVSWAANTEPDISGYRIYWGSESGIYTDSQFVSGMSTTMDTITGLFCDSTYYVTVRALDMLNRLSYLATEVTGIPRLAPMTPSCITATPIQSGIDIVWFRNTELDIAGYRLYRRINDNPTYDSLNTALLTDTTFTDHPLSGANRYYYALRAFDLDGNYSPMSAEAYGRPITLDQGILIVDETRNGTNPPDSLQDEFYRYIMANYPYTEYEYGSAGEAPVFADFVPYSTVLWHTDEYTENLASSHVADFESYLALGGNMWFIGWRPTANLEGQTSYPFDFTSGDFMYDYYKVSHVEVTTPFDSFIAADGLLGYPRLEVDSVKVPFSAWHGALRYIEAFTPASGAEQLYTMDMRNNSSSYEGALCGIRYLGNDFKVVYFGFPLYFMDQDDARSVALQVMADFGETGVHEMPNLISPLSGVILHQNTPNPFAGQTLISYQLGMAGQVRLSVYNIAGQLVKTLVDTHHEPGEYNIIWSGTDERGRQVSNGVYFCFMDTDDQKTIRKMTILR